VPTIVWVLLALAVILGGAGVVLRVAFSPVLEAWLELERERSDTQGKRPETGPGSGGEVPAGEHLQWGGAPATLSPVKLDDDDVEDFVGVYRLLDRSGTTTMYLGAFDGRTLSRRWHSAALGSARDNGYHVRSAVAGGRVVVTDTSMVAHVLELASGKEVGSVKLTDHAQRVCSEPAGDHVWIKVADGHNVVIDLQSVRASSAPAPMFCSFKEAPACDGEPGACVDAYPAPQVSGFVADRVFHEGNLGVALGAKSPGTRAPMLAGFDVATSKVNWSVPVASAGISPSPLWPAAQLANGSFYVVYALNTLDGAMVARFDVATGKRVWEARLPRANGTANEEIVVTPTRVYVPHWTWLDIFNLADGTHVGTVGMW